MGGWPGHQELSVLLVEVPSCDVKPDVSAHVAASQRCRPPTHRPTHRMTCIAQSGVPFSMCVLADVCHARSVWRSTMRAFLYSVLHK